MPAPVLSPPGMKANPYSGAALRRSAWHFLSGKGISALLTLALLLWLVRSLPVAEYGAYVALVAGMEIMLAVASIGLPWMASRYLPEYRLHAPGGRIAGLVAQFVSLHAGALTGFALLSWLLLPPYLAWAGLGAYDEASRLYLLVLLAEGVGRYAREPILGLLMQQGIGRASLVLRQLSFLTLLAGLALEGQVHLIDVVRAELVASIVGGLVALAGLGRHVSTLRTLPGQPAWREPRWPEMWRVAWNMYAANLLTLLYSPQILTVLIQRALGAEATAVFGFMRSLYLQIAHNLPAQLMISLVRPKLVASYVSGGIGELTRNANLVGKLSLFIVFPLLAIAGLGSENIIALLSGGKFGHTGWLFFGFMLTLVPLSQRQILETVAVTSGQSNLCTWAAAGGVLILPVMLSLLQARFGLWSAVIALFVGQALFNAVLLAGLVRSTDYRLDMIAPLKMAASSIVAYLITANSLGWIGDGMFLLFVQMAVVSMSYLLMAALTKPFGEDERKRLNSLLRVRVFI